MNMSEKSKLKQQWMKGVMTAKEIFNKYPRSRRPWNKFVEERKDSPHLTYRRFLSGYIGCSENRVDVRRADQFIHFCSSCKKGMPKKELSEPLFMCNGCKKIYFESIKKKVNDE